MKTLTKVIFVSLMSFFLTSSLFAQATANASATVIASLTKGLAISVTIDNLDFGTIQLTGAAVNPAITADNGVQWEVLGHPSKNVTVTYAATASLINDAWATPLSAPTDNLVFTPDVWETDDDNTWNGQAALASGATVPLVNVIGTGTLYIWSGGTIAVKAAQEAGDYTGTFTMNVAY